MTARFQDAWQRGWPLLANEFDALVLVAFRLLVCQLEHSGFFLEDPAKIYAPRARKSPPQLTTLLRSRASALAEPFVRFIAARLASPVNDLTAAAAFAIDFELGQELSEHLRRSDRARLRVIARAVNGANRVLMEAIEPAGAIVLVRSPNRYWKDVENVVPEFFREPQDVPSMFHHLIPTTTRLSRVDYSNIGGEGTTKVVVALWPAPAPRSDSAALATTEINTGTRSFRFKRWHDLPVEIQTEQLSFADRIARYVESARGGVGAFHILAAPELTLPQQSRDRINAAVESRRNGSWLIFPGSYHIDQGSVVVNQAAIRVGGVLDKSDLSVHSRLGVVSAVKRIPFIFWDDAGTKYVEQISRLSSSVHLLDSGIGRIAVMICLDFLDPVLRKEVVDMGTDHLIVLSMSPDSGAKFRTAMSDASNFRTATFLVNAFTAKALRRPRYAAFRKPLKNSSVEWKQPSAPGGCCVVQLRH